MRKMPAVAVTPTANPLGARDGLVMMASPGGSDRGWLVTIVVLADPGITQPE
jgi:hypothetical protein